MTDNNFPRLVSFPILAFVLLIASPAISRAHGVVSKEIEPGKIRFSYDDDSPMAHGYVTVFDKEDKEIATGQADVEGIFDYSPYENVARISAEDAHGHKRIHSLVKSGHSHEHRHSGENTATVIGVLVALLGIAALFYLANRKKNATSSKR